MKNIMLIILMRMMLLQQLHVLLKTVNLFLLDNGYVLENPNTPETLISKIDTESAKELFESGIITGGMIPKLKNCLEAVQNDVKRVHILDGRLEHSLLIEIFTKKGVGTMIKR